MPEDGQYDQNAAYTDGTNKICCDWWQHACQFLYGIPQWDEFYKNCNCVIWT
jgi:hypothetical protein